jgi:SAM-dependent MidA family methyltransferase
VDFTTARRAAAGEGVELLVNTDQCRFLLALGLAERLGEWTGSGIQDVKRRLAARTLVAPGGLGSTHRVLLFGRGVHGADGLLRALA